MSKLLDYIDWSAICEDHSLKHGDITPYQTEMLNSIIQDFISQNKTNNLQSIYTIHEIELEYQDVLLVIHYSYEDGVEQTYGYIGDAPEVEIQAIYLKYEDCSGTATNLYEVLNYNKPLLEFIEREILTKQKD
jgi:hypothetical protein|tara:strand:- start:51 stop:449 length:399 start_codon:yes stop_codon:yes gene_type:complete